jgi:hypothetical protein
MFMKGSLLKWGCASGLLAIAMGIAGLELESRALGWPLL